MERIEEKLRSDNTEKLYRLRHSVRKPLKKWSICISLTDDSRLPEGKKLILKDCCSNGAEYKGFSSLLMSDENGAERNQLWEKISEILLECTS